MPKYDCISIGSAIVDIVVKSKQFKLVKNGKFDSSTALCELLGAKINVDKMHVSSGGGATNSACSLAHFGLKTACLSVVTNDSLSEIILDDLKRFNVTTDLLKMEKGENTPVSIVLTASNGARTVLTKRGISKNIDSALVKKTKLDTKWVYLTNLGGDFEKVIKVIEALKVLNIRILWNPGIDELKDINLDYLNLVDILLLNVEEAVTISQNSSSNLLDTIKFFSQRVKSKIVLITAGERGAFLVANEKCYFVDAYLIEEVESTVGAGDAFGSGFLQGVIKNMPFDVCLEYAIKNASSVLKQMGAKESFITNLKSFPKPKIKKVF